MNEILDETTAFWLGMERESLAEVAAEMHRQRRIWNESLPPTQVQLVRKCIAGIFIRGNGLEVGAGTRPFPIPESAKCYYGDVLNESELKTYFSVSSDITNNGLIDAQTFHGIADSSVDFVISAHVIEHSENPIVSIRNAIRILSSGGILLLVVPDREHTWDNLRPPTSLEHLLLDELDGGESTRIISYREHMTYLHPQWQPALVGQEFEDAVQKMVKNRDDTHFHCWNASEFRELISYILKKENAEYVGDTFVVNENIFVIKKLKIPN